MSKRMVNGLVLLAWIALATTGMVLLERYSGRPGEAAHAPSHWPARSHITRSPIRPTLLVFLHPRCACSQATVADLDRMMTHVQGRVEAHALILRPAGVEDDWMDGAIWQAAHRVTGVDVLTDSNGYEATVFGVATSGQALLYDSHGELVFRGGLTVARSHEGDCSGVRALTTVLLGGTAREVATDVFGCALCKPVSPSQ